MGKLHQKIKAIFLDIDGTFFDHVTNQILPSSMEAIQKAKENGYKLDEMGILALYSRIDVMQREDHAVTVAEVKEIMDEAIAHSQKANVKHLARRVFGKSTDDSDRVILKEEDFKI